jgi:hypothetical protein
VVTRRRTPAPADIETGRGNENGSRLTRAPAVDIDGWLSADAIEKERAEIITADGISTWLRARTKAGAEHLTPRV